MVDAELLEILVCPEDKTPVALATADILASLNARIAAGGIKTRGGAPVTEAVTEGLVRADGKYLYPVREDIPVMLIDEAVTVDDAEHERLMAKAKADNVRSTLSEG